jgi:taurine dehydrogenase small subunit
MGSDLAKIVERYNRAWNEQDLEAIASAHAPDVVFQNHTAGERVEGAEAVREHIAGIFSRWPDMRFSGRSLYVGEGFVVCEWTATATRSDGSRIEWDGVDLFPFRDGLIARKDVYSTSHAARVLE